MYILFVLLFPTLVFSLDMQTLDLNLPLTTVENHGKKLNLTIGLGSGAYHPSNEPDIVYFVTDRGPNLLPDEAKELLGVDVGEKKGRVFPIPSFSPTIYKIKLEKDSYKILETISIKDKGGKNITGLPNPNTENGFDVSGKKIDDQIDSLDTEALVKLKDGTFYVTDEYQPSLVHLDATGKMLERFTPGNGLPSIFSKRKINRGIEAMTLSPDEKYLYYALESPLEHPNQDVLEKSRLVRVCRFNIKDKKTDRHYAYLLDEAKTFLDDENGKQSSVKLSDMSMIDRERIMFVERIEKTTKLFIVKIHSITYKMDNFWSEEKTRPALEEMDDQQLKKTRIHLLPKQLILDSADLSPKLPSKIEGITSLGNNEWLIINDNDFGISGQTTKMVRFKLDIPPIKDTWLTRLFNKLP